MKESIKIDILCLEVHAGSLIESLANIVQENEEYKLQKRRNDITGTPRLLFSRDGFNIEFRSPRSGESTGRFRVQAGRINEKTDLTDIPNLREMINAFVDLYTAIDGSPVMGFGIAPSQPVAVPLPEGDYPSSPRRFINWLDLYPPEEVERIGRQTLLSTPAPEVEELDDGSILVVSKHPFSDDPIEDIANHIGIHFWGQDPGLVR
ncbi:hypothetical protein IL252_15750 [Halomicrobium sp. IBSBa]|uniref:hypothetical protein n=1 Tax=Halomicrobium sp. IBSBa TaxID=2778916 RepID=UPI001ABF2C67|nr:hypothetical protein [Halomicrobium sp. IBSBa]MBO4249270.1 hypothetical protein [Halomicrobium sp. IBSBa]